MCKEYHLYLYTPEWFINRAPKNYVSDNCIRFTVNEVNEAIKNGENICTFQVVTCTTDLFRHGYRIFVHNSNKDTYEIKLGDNERTGREIKMSNCLYNLILSGEFDKNE